MTHFSFKAGIAAGIMSVTLNTHSQEVRPDNYPQRPIRFIVPFVAGGSYDAVARLVSNGLSDNFKYQIVVDNRPGAGGLIGTKLFQNAQADGYTVGMFGNPQTISVNVNPNADYDVEKDFTPIAPLAILDNVFVVSNTVPVQSLKDFVSLAKTKPGQFNYGSGGVGATTHLAGELFKSRAGVNILHVPYKGAGIAVTELVSGRIQFMVVNMVLARSLIESGRVKGLAVASTKRSPFLPEIPSAVEAGLPGFEFNQWYSVVGPKNVPSRIVNRLHRDITKVVVSDVFKSALGRQGVEPMSFDLDTFARFIKEDVAKYRKIVQEQKISIN